MDKKKVFKILGIAGSICTVIGAIFGAVTERSEVQAAVEEYMKNQ